MAGARRKTNPAESNGDFGFVIQSEVNAVVSRVPVRFYLRNGRQIVLTHDDASGTTQPAALAPNNALAAIVTNVCLFVPQMHRPLKLFHEFGQNHLSST